MAFMRYILLESGKMFGQGKKNQIDNIHFLNQNFTSFSVVYVYTASSLGKKSYLRTSEGRYQKMSQKIK